MERQNLDLEIAEIRRIETELFGKNEEALDHLQDVVHAILGRVGARTQHSADKTSTGA